MSLYLRKDCHLNLGLTGQARLAGQCAPLTCSPRVLGIQASVTTPGFLQVRDVSLCGNHFTKLPIQLAPITSYFRGFQLSFYICVCMQVEVNASCLPQPLPTTAFNLSVNMELTDWLEHSRDPQVSISVLLLMYNPWIKLGCQVCVVNTCRLSHLSKLTFSCYFKEFQTINEEDFVLFQKGLCCHFLCWELSELHTSLQQAGFVTDCVGTEAMVKMNRIKPNSHDQRLAKGKGTIVEPVTLITGTFTSRCCKKESFRQLFLGSGDTGSFEKLTKSQRYIYL